MRSTDTAPSLTIAYRRADVTGFWVLGGAFVSVTGMVLASQVGAAVPWVWGIGAAAAVLVPGLLWAQWYETGVRAWNGLARRVAAALRTYILGVSYYVLFPAIGAAGSSLHLEPPDGTRSRWVPRGEDGTREGTVSSTADGAWGWPRGVLEFSRTRGNLWAVCLLPLVFLLTLLPDEQQESAPPSSTYTLY